MLDACYIKVLLICRACNFGSRWLCW